MDHLDDESAISILRIFYSSGPRRQSSSHSATGERSPRRGTSVRDTHHHHHHHTEPEQHPLQNV